MKKPKKSSLVTPEGLHARIAEQAYRLFIERGREHGHDLDDWLLAERLITGTTELEPRRPGPVVAVS